MEGRDGARGRNRRMTRIWQNLREPRSAIAMLSAILALFLSILQLRILAENWVAGIVGLSLIGSIAGAVTLLAGGVATLRRGNLVFLLVAWAFVFGQKFGAVLRFLEEGIQAGARANYFLAVLSANVDSVILMAGTAMALVSVFTGRRRAKPP